MTAVYTCAMCSGVFLYGRPEEESRTEAVKLWDMDPCDGGMEVICDNCFQTLPVASMSRVNS